MGRRPFVRYGRFGLPALVLGVLAAFPAIVQVADHTLVSQTYADSTNQLKTDDDTLELSGLQRHFQAVAKRVAPTVVAISAANTKTDSDESLHSDAMNAEKLEAILDRGIRTVGTGFIVDPDGFILTNEHVVGDAEQIWITTDTGKVYPAVVVGSDPRSDLAVLKIPATNLPTVRFARFDSVERGQWTIALGNPYGLAGAGEMAMSVGVVSAIDRSLPKLASKENRLYSNLIQTTAQINPGNSGGPLFDINGDVIAVNTAVILPQKQTNGIGFAMPINQRMIQLISDMKQGREIIHGYLGVMVVTPTTRERKSAGITQDGGARIDSIEPDSPASKSGLQLDDIILSINGQPVHNSDHFVRMIGDVSVQQPSTLDIRRNGKPLQIGVTPARREPPSIVVSRENQRMRWKGLLIGPIPANWEAAKKSISGLMVVAVDPQSPMVKQGIRQGSIITAVAGKPVGSIVQLQQIVNDTPAETCSVKCEPADAVASTEH